MQRPIDLAWLRQAVALLPGETVIMGMAARRRGAGGWVPGLALVTSDRFVFQDPSGGQTAFPIFKMLDLVITAPRRLSVSVWFGRLDLKFDNAAMALALLNLLRQDHRWRSAADVHGDTDAAAVQAA